MVVEVRRDVGQLAAGVVVGRDPKAGGRDDMPVVEHAGAAGCEEVEVAVALGLQGPRAAPRGGVGGAGAEQPLGLGVGVHEVFEA